MRVKQNELESNNEVIKELHAECDWLKENFAARREVRGDEMDSLKSALTVLTEFMG